MSNFPMNNLFEMLTPSEAQRTNMLSEINAQLDRQTGAAVSGRMPRRKRFSALAACLCVLLLATTAYAATDDRIVSSVKNGANRIFFAGGDSIVVEHTDGSHTNVGIDSSNSKWLVKEKGRKLLLTVDGQKIDITKTLLKRGYYYYDYQDSSNVLHRLYIVKNAGGKKDYAERWYSQMEWLPEKGMGGSHRGMSGPLAVAIMSAESEAKEGAGTLDDELLIYLKAYWEKYGE